MQSQLFRLGWRDLGKGLIVSIATAVVLAFQAQLMDPAFSLATANYMFFAQVALSAGIAYLAKNLVSDQEGKVLGKF